MSGKGFNAKGGKEYKGIRLKSVPTIEKKGVAAVMSSFCDIVLCFWQVQCCSFPFRSTKHFLLAAKAI